MSEEKNFWYNTRTGEVEEGPQSLGTDRIGPFATRDEAARALEIVAARAKQWNDEDAADDQD
ncbi:MULTISPECIES: SPOR domain-containing protein [unclassified Pseudoclavibacter]|uniref:SPOR domain-containing protein n=1 Tax=unclassified Pseudoclavibacter TaxID=2615177 RepID=UPI001300E2E2|nr:MULTISPECIES: SPOR domain-containing protein [unclassified Pseudoclavibacter]KAB1646280.1 SPOR domain-containing protein [Pseudoclavibacter sp. CFCC 14310]KAB1663558.1 SPOR domain-containing protein [Pseudoclavibacter sp. CFCC 13611]